MVVAVLIVVWVVALTPYALRKLGEWQVSSELDRFRRGLGALRQFAPEEDCRPGATPVPTGERGSPRRVGIAGHDGAAAASRAGRERSAQLVMRRRRTLAWLACSLVGSFLFGAIPWFRPLWDLSLVVLILGVAYLAALVYVQRQAVLAAEREAKIIRLRALRSADGSADGTAATAGHLAAERGALVRLRAVAAAGGGGNDPSVVVAMPRRPSFVLVEAPS